MQLGGFPFRLYTDVRHRVDGVNRRVPVGENVPSEEKWLSFFLRCNTDADGRLSDSSGEWEIYTSVVLRLFQHTQNEENTTDDVNEVCWEAYVKRLTHEHREWGWTRFAGCKVGAHYRTGTGVTTPMISISSFQQLLSDASKSAITLCAEVYPMDARSYERCGGNNPQGGVPDSREGPMTLRELGRRRAGLDKEE